ncbi:hypothetical protein HY230_08850 [Candidatus Acetothermia bacterium]|nr:hypothetical protein [Candidatus Acetothermia bacterium]
MKTILESTLTPPKHITEVEKRSEKDDALFVELTAVLKKYNALNRFGITLLHRHFDISQDECLLEETDVENRKQNIQPISANLLRDEKITETSWRLGDGFVAPATFCVGRTTRKRLALRAALDKQGSDV